KMLKPLNRQAVGIDQMNPERIVQFGGGNFLRAFIDWMVDELNDQADFASGVVIVKATPQGSYADLDAQDGLFHVQLHGLDAGLPVTQRKLITCVNRTVNPYQDYESYLELARQPEVRFLVSNTTEAGIVFDPAALLEDHPAANFPAKMAAFLIERYRHFAGSPERGCILLPCELIEQNGDQLKQIILKYAELWQIEAGFMDWLEAHSLFCNTLVDRIVSGFPEKTAEAIREGIGFDDHLLVEGELYHSFVIEAPDWLHNELPVRKTNLNVKIVSDVRPYREMKVRILNGAHTAMVSPGYFCGLKTVQEVVEHPVLSKFVHDLIFEEVVPSLTMPEAETRPFAEAILTRFHNPFIHHRLQSIALNSLSKFKARLLPSLIAYESRYHQLPDRIVLAMAALIRFYKGDWQNQSIPLNDNPDLIAWFDLQWKTEDNLSKLVTAVLKNEALWGAESGNDLIQIPHLIERLTDYLEKIDSDGMLQTIKASEIAKH
ncbi:MAG TPA: tagaturonate reductase, partial [Phototrophicaceae bacterium]|nr:tagaturonate reductase [Phototrophicaceae bacterium]